MNTGEPRKARKKKYVSYVNKKDSFFKRNVARFFEKVTGADLINRKFKEIIAVDPAPNDVWPMMMDKLSLKVDYDQKTWDLFPENEPVVIVANHPFGIVDGIILGDLVNSKRKNFGILAHGLLSRAYLLKDFFLPVDFNENPDAKKNNRKMKGNALTRLKEGASIIVFPGGGVATAKRPWKKPEEYPWKLFAARLIHETQATVIPVFVHGKNSRWFHLGAFIHPIVRSGLLINEVRNKIGTTTKLNIGNPISYNQISHIKNKQELTDYLQKTVFSLA